MSRGCYSWDMTQTTSIRSATKPPKSAPLPKAATGPRTHCHHDGCPFAALPDGYCGRHTPEA